MVTKLTDQSVSLVARHGRHDNSTAKETEKPASGEAARGPAGRATRGDTGGGTRGILGQRFCRTRLEDVARRAGVAKGTIYLYFRDKESLFQELVRAMLGPLVRTIEAAPMADLSARAVAEAIADMFAREIFGTRRKDVIRLFIAEGCAFRSLRSSIIMK